MKRNYFIILYLLLISSITFAQKDDLAKRDVRELMPSLTIMHDKEGGGYDLPVVKKGAKAVPPIGGSVLLSEDFQNLSAPDYFPAGWEQFDFDGAFVYGVFDNVYLYDSEWMSLSLNSDPTNSFMASFSFLYSYPPLAYYTKPADDWMVTSAVSIPAAESDILLLFKTMSLNAGYLDGLQIYVIENSAYEAMRDEQTSEWLVSSSTLIYNSSTEPATWNQREISLNDFKGKNVRIMFRNNTYDMFAIGIDDIIVAIDDLDEDDVIAPKNLTAEQDRFDVNLSWESHIGEIGWANSNATIMTAHLLTDVTEYIQVARFEPADLTAYNGMKLYGVKFGTLDNEAANQLPEYMSLTLKIYTGGSLGSPGTVVLTQSIPDWTIGWNDVMFDAPITVDATKELWIGLEIKILTDTQVYPLNSVYSNTYGGIAGVTNKSDVLYINQGWTTYTQILIDGGSTPYAPNWAISGIVVDEASNVPAFITHNPVKPQKRNIQEEQKAGFNVQEILSLNPYAKPSINYSPSKYATPIRYNIYRNNEFIATAINELTYTDKWAPIGTNNYCVTSVYGFEDIESDPVCKTINVQEVIPVTDLSTTFEGFEYGVLEEGWMHDLSARVDWEFSDSYWIYDMFLGIPEPYSDGSYAWFDGLLWDAGAYANLISPYIKPTADKSTLRFELRNQVYPEDAFSWAPPEAVIDRSAGTGFKVSVSVDQGRTWTAIYDITKDYPGYPYVDFNAIVNLDLSAYIDQAIFLQFHAICNAGISFVAMDNMELTEANDCPPVTGLAAVQGDDTNTVAVTWDTDSQVVYETGFEDGIPTSWSVLDEDGDGNNWLLGETPSIIAHTGTKSMYSRSWVAGTGDLTPDNWLISDKIELTDNNMLTFWVAAQDAEYPEDHYGVYISTTDKNITSFTKLFEETLTAAPAQVNGLQGEGGLTRSNAGKSGSWKQKSIDLSTYEGKEVYIAFRHFDSTGQYAIVLDDVSITSKFPTYNLYRDGVLIAENLTEGNYIEELDSTGTYVYSVTQTREGCTSDPAYSTLNFISVCDLYPITNLVAEQNDKYINLTWSNPSKAFYNEGFENGGAIPTGWTQEAVSGTMAWTFVTSNYTSYPAAAASGQYFAVFADRSSAANVRKLVSPQFDLSDKASVILGFKMYAGSWLGDITQLRVYYKNAANADWVLLGGTTGAVTPWSDIEVNLPNLTSTYWIAFEAIGSYGYGLAIDDVKLKGPYDVPKNIYRDGELIAEGVLGTTYTDKIRTSGTYEYCVNMAIENCETVPACADITVQVGEINTEFPNNELPFEWEIIVGDDAKWEFADTYAARDMEDAYVPFADGDGTFAWFNSAYWDYNDYSYLVSPEFEPIDGENVLAFDLAAIKTAINGNVGQGAGLYVDIYDDGAWKLGTVNYLAAIPGYNKTSVGMDLVCVELDAYMKRDIRVRFRGVSDRGAFVTAIDNVQLTDKLSIYNCKLNPVTDLTANVANDGVTLLWDAPASSPAMTPATNQGRKISSEQLNAMIVKHDRRAKSGKDTWITHFESGIPSGWITENNTYQASYGTQIAWQPHTDWSVSNYGDKPGTSFVWFDSFNFIPSDPAHLITHEFAVTGDEKTMIIEVQECTMDPQYRDAGEAIYIDYSTDGGSSWTNGTTNILASLSGYNSATTAITEQSYDLSAYVGQKVKVRFRGVSDYGACLAVLHSVELPGTGGGGGGTPVTLMEEYFEGSAEGWTVADADGDGRNWELMNRSQFQDPESLVVYEGDGFASSASFDNTAGALTPDNWLISPSVTLTADATLTYAIGAMDGLWPSEKYAVYVSTTTTDLTSFEKVFEETMTAAPGHKRTSDAEFGKNGVSKAQGAWYTRSVDLSAYTGETVYIAFRHYDSTDWFRLNLDAVKVATKGGDEDDGFGDNDNPLTYTVTRDGAILAEGLTSVSYKDTTVDVNEYGTYEYAVFAVKGLCTSDEAVVIVETGPDCGKNKVSSFVADVDNDIVKLNWTAYDESVTEAFDIYENGVKIAEGITTNTLDIVPTTTGDIDYCVVAIGANCESDPACSNIYYMPTNVSKVNGKIAVYPTITKGNVTVDTPADANVMVTDVSGRILETAQSTGKLELNLNYSNGVYLIVVDIDGVVSTHKVVIRK